MKDKIAVFYTIGQIDDWWEEEFYTKQLTRLQESIFYKDIDVININVIGNRLPLPFILDKTNTIIYSDFAPNGSSEWHQYIYNFCLKNPDYKILQFHSIGVSYKYEEEHKSNKLKFRDYLETIIIDNGQDCINLLNNYDLVGTDLVQTAIFDFGKYIFDSPHFQGAFWWAKANYISTLDPSYLFQDVPYQKYLTELWIGINNPKIYNFYSSNQNHYYEEVNPPYDFILEKTKEHLNKLSIS